MIPQDPQSFVLIISSAASIVGILSIVTGIFVLVAKVMGSDVRALANQTQKLLQKGINEDVSGLVGNASTLIEALNQLVKTTTGVGIFLILVGFCLLAAAYAVVGKFF